MTGWRHALAWLFALALAPLAAAQPPIPAFSAAQPGTELPAPWRALGFKDRRMSDVRLVRDDVNTVLRVRSENAFGTASITVDLEAKTIAWRWKVDRVLDRSRLGTKEGDDYAARVYVTFDIPLEDLSFAARTRLQVARLLYGEVPSAAICYVWDNREAPGYSTWSPYTDRVRVVVLQSGGARTGQWVEERRDVDADFRAAFGRPAPRISGIAAGNDTDQTGESVTAWFGDFRVEAR